MGRARTGLGRLATAIRHPISQNTVALYWVQVATFIVPLVTLPYISRVLGPTEFGLVLFAQSFSFILGILIDFGFGASATRHASKVRDDPHRLSHLAARVLTAKLLLVGVAAALSVAGFVFLDKLHDNPDLLALAWVAAVAQGLSPGWFFVGIERLRLVSVVQLTSRVIAAALTFVLVSGPGDAWIILALYAGVSVASGLLVTRLMYRHIPARAPVREGSMETLREAGVLFIGNGALTLYTSANLVLLGLFVSSAQVAHFGAAERIVRAGTQLIGPVTVAVYPRIALLQSTGERERAGQLAWITIAVLGGLGLLGATIVSALADPLITVIYGDDYGEAIPVLRILSLIVPLIAVTATLAGGWMLSLHMDKKIVWVAIAAAVTNLVLAVALTPLLGPVGMACSVVSAEAVALIGCVVAIRRYEDDWTSGQLLPRRRRSPADQDPS